MVHQTDSRMHSETLPSGLLTAGDNPSLPVPPFLTLFVLRLSHIDYILCEFRRIVNIFNRFKWKSDFHFKHISFYRQMEGSLL